MLQHNTLRRRQDFTEQKCKLEEVCNQVGVTFHLLPICHPELNPIEGNNVKGKEKYKFDNQTSQTKEKFKFVACHRKLNPKPCCLCHLSFSVSLFHPSKLLELHKAICPRKM